MSKKFYLMAFMFLSFNGFSQVVKDMGCGFYITLPAGYKEVMDFNQFVNDSIWGGPIYAYIISDGPLKLDSMANSKVNEEIATTVGTEVKVTVVNNVKYKNGNIEGWLLVYEKPPITDPTFNFINVHYYFNVTNTTTKKVSNVQLLSYTPVTGYADGREALIKEVLNTIHLK